MERACERVCLWVYLTILSCLSKDAYDYHTILHYNVKGKGTLLDADVLSKSRKFKSNFSKCCSKFEVTWLKHLPFRNSGFNLLSNSYMEQILEVSTIIEQVTILFHSVCVKLSFRVGQPHSNSVSLSEYFLHEISLTYNAVSFENSLKLLASAVSHFSNKNTCFIQTLHFTKFKMHLAYISFKYNFINFRQIYIICSLKRESRCMFYWQDKFWVIF